MMTENLKLKILNEQWTKQVHQLQVDYQNKMELLRQNLEKKNQQEALVYQQLLEEKRTLILHLKETLSALEKENASLKRQAKMNSPEPLLPSEGVSAEIEELHAFQARLDAQKQRGMKFMEELKGAQAPSPFPPSPDVDVLDFAFLNKLT